MIKLVPAPSKKVQANIPEATHDFFFGNRGVLYGVDGAQTHLINKVFTLLKDELTRIGITEFDFENDTRVERILNQLQFVTSGTGVRQGEPATVSNGLANPSPSGQAAPPMDGRGTPSVHHGEAGTANLTPSSQGTQAGSKRPPGGKRGQAKAGKESGEVGKPGTR